MPGVLCAPGFLLCLFILILDSYSLFKNSFTSAGVTFLSFEYLLLQTNFINLVIPDDCE
jgi:hypothetical protein